jgi:formylglycine-generating enzyme required for sulfatase activity
MTKEDLITEIRARAERAREELPKKTISGQEREYGYYDALGELLEWIDSNIKCNAVHTSEPIDEPINWILGNRDR